MKASSASAGCRAMADSSVWMASRRRPSVDSAWARGSATSCPARSASSRTTSAPAASPVCIRICAEVTTSAAASGRPSKVSSAWSSTARASSRRLAAHSAVTTGSTLAGESPTRFQSSSDVPARGSESARTVPRSAPVSTASRSSTSAWSGAPSWNRARATTRCVSGIERTEEECAVEPGQGEAWLSSGARGLVPAGDAVEDVVRGMGVDGVRASARTAATFPAAARAASRASADSASCRPADQRDQAHDRERHGRCPACASRAR